MKNNELIERYVLAVSRQLPAKSREDVSRELRTLVSDMLDERCGGVEATEKDARVVLTELGRPDELARKYSPERENCLIGQPLYATYLTVLKIVLAAVSFGLSVAIFISVVVGTPQNWWLTIGEWIANLFNANVSAFAFVTIGFALAYHFGARMEADQDFLDDLPSLPQAEKPAAPWEAIVGIVFSVLFGVLFLVFPDTNIPFFASAGTSKAVPILSPEVLKSMRLLIAAVAGVGILKNAIALHDRRFSPALMAASLVSNALSVVFAWSFLTNPHLLNPEFVQALAGVFEGDAGVLLTQFSWLGKGLLGLTFFGAVVDSIKSVVNTVKHM